MQSITALAHLKACILYFIDISETCGYTIKQQIQLFNNIKPLFKNKPLLIVLTKIDLKKYDELSEEDQNMIKHLSTITDVSLLEMSNKTGEGLSKVKEAACVLLNNFRLD